MVLYCTDVVAIKTAITPRLDLDEQCELWIEFGVGKHHKYLVVHEIADALGPVRSMALPVFHSLTGCDAVSTFQGKDTKTGLDVWCTLPEIIETFQLFSTLSIWTIFIICKDL